MKQTISRKLSVFVWIFICFAALVPCGRLEAADSAAVKRQFSDPPREYHSAPLWVWNDMLTDEQIVSTMRDLAGQQVMMAARHDRNKQPVGFAVVAEAVQAELERIQQDLYDAAIRRREENTYVIDSWDDFTDLYANRGGGFAQAHWCGDGACEKAVQEKTKVTIRNMPFGRDETPGECVHCGKPSIGRVVFAQAY